MLHWQEQGKENVVLPCCRIALTGNISLSFWASADKRLSVFYRHIDSVKKRK